MSEYMFGLGDGHLGKAAARIARRHGAELVNHNDPGCRCGYGCGGDNCPSTARHWFACQNQGEPFDSEVARAVMADLERAGIESCRK